MKNILFLLGLILFISSICLATQITTVAGTYDDTTYSLEMNIQKGWNIIPSGGYFESQDCLKAGWIWSPTNNKYLGGTTNSPSADPEITRIISEDTTNNYLYAQSYGAYVGGMWAYSTCSQKYTKNFQFNYQDELNKYKLAKGWNFMTITPAMVGMKMKDLFANCELTGYNGWDATNQQWALSTKELMDNTIASIQTIDTPLPQNNIGQVLLVRVANECNLSKGSSSITPPSLPGGDSTPSTGNPTTGDLLLTYSPVGITSQYQIKTRYSPTNTTSVLFLTFKNNTQENIKLKKVVATAVTNTEYSSEANFGSGIEIESGSELETQVENVSFLLDGTYQHFIEITYTDANLIDKTMEYPISIKGNFEEVNYEEVACETDFFTDLESDVTCNISYTGPEYNETKTASCVISPNDDTYGNICVPEPTIYIKVQNEEGYSPVPGLTGTFSGVTCSSIDTSYNSTRFFVNCDNKE